ADLAFGDVLLVPFPLATPASRAAAQHAAARGIIVVAGATKDSRPLDGVLQAPKGAEAESAMSATALAGRVACAQSYAVGIGLGRLTPGDLATIEGLAWNLEKALAAVDARKATRAPRHPLVKVVLDEAKILVNGD